MRILCLLLSAVQRQKYNESRQAVTPEGIVMNRLVCLSLVLSTGLVAGSSSADRPNVVLIMSDDQGYGDFGAAGNAELHAALSRAGKQRGVYQVEIQRRCLH